MIFTPPVTVPIVRDVEGVKARVKAYDDARYQLRKGDLKEARQIKKAERVAEKERLLKKKRSKQKKRDRSKEYYHRNKKSISENYRVLTPEEIESRQKRSKDYRDANKARLLETAKKRRDSNPLFQLTHNLRSRTYLAFTANGYTKKSTTSDILGADYMVVKNHLESLFYGDMSWENYGTLWQVDHIYPLIMAEDEDHLIGLCHYLNLQPLFTYDNLEKNATLPENWTI